jgi:four helix bundle protein
MTAVNQQNEALELSVQLFKDIYQATETWPSAQVFGLIMDIRRAAISVSSNLGEGQNQAMGSETLQFVTISQDSLAKLTDYLLTAKQNPALAAHDVESLLQQAAELTVKLRGLSASLT